MKKSVIINFPDNFVFPKEYNYESCEKCIFCHCDTYDPVDFCSANINNICPFYGKNENIEI